jgi:DNA-binding CsgD family transcriptional regulator
MKINRSRVTQRQKDIIYLIADGLTSFQIGGVLNIKENTVNSHRQSAMRLLGVDNANDLVKVAIKENLIKKDGRI